MVRIPDRIFTTVKKEFIVKQHATNRMFKARDAFCVSADSEKMVALAKKWSAIELPEVPNDIITGLILVDYVERSRGASVYKVILPGGLYVDFRDIYFLDALFRGKIRNNKVHSEFIWVQNTSQMTLAEVGSPLHKKALLYKKKP